MNQRVKESIKELKKLRKIHSQADFAKECGIGVVQLSEIVSGKRRVSEYYVNKILTRFPEINRSWLVNGNGEMLKNHSANAENHSISIAGEEIKENKINVNTDETIAMLLTEFSAQRKLTEKTLAEVAAQRQLVEIALKQNSDLIALLKGQD